MADTMKGLKRTHYCGTVTPEMIGREVVVCGWAQKTRDMGTLVFIDLRDRTGIVQLAFDDKTDPALLAKAQKVRAEYVDFLQRGKHGHKNFYALVRAEPSAVLSEIRF